MGSRANDSPEATSWRRGQARCYQRGHRELDLLHALLLKVMIERRLNLPQTGRFLCGTLGTTALPFWPALRTDSLVILHGHQRFVALPVDQLYAHR